MITDTFGTVESRRDFMPFGEELYADGTYRKESHDYSLTGQDPVRQRFTGYQRDIETNLDFAEARYYNSAHGRFTAVDPLLASGKSANPQTFNRYAYALSNPLILVDPSGLQVGFATGPVYQRGNEFAIFKGRGSVPADYHRVRGTIETTTSVKGVDHHLTVKPDGWKVGDRVDNVKFAPAAPAEAKPAPTTRAGDLVKAVNDAPAFKVAEAIHKAATPDSINLNVQAPIVPFGGSVSVTSDLDVVVSPHAGRDYGSFSSGGVSAGFTWATDTDATSSREQRTSFFLDNSVSAGGCYTICAGGTLVPGEHQDRLGVNLAYSPTPSASLTFGHGIYVGNLLGREPPKVIKEGENDLH